jgi:hypothetical protein
MDNNIQLVNNIVTLDMLTLINNALHVYKIKINKNQL